MTIEDIQQSINTFSFDKSDQELADAWVLASSYQKRFKPASDEYKLLSKFMTNLEAKRKELAKVQPIIEEIEDATVS